jgi:hypothetical protein
LGFGGQAGDDLVIQRRLAAGEAFAVAPQREQSRMSQRVMGYAATVAAAASNSSSAAKPGSRSDASLEPMFDKIGSIHRRKPV